MPKTDQCSQPASLQSCQHNTEGPRCDKCRSGYFGDPSRGRPDDCKPCPCPYYETSRRWGVTDHTRTSWGFIGQGVKKHTPTHRRTQQEERILLSFYCFLFFQLIFNPFFWMSFVDFPTLASWTSTNSRHVTPAGPATQEGAVKSEIAYIWYHCALKVSASRKGKIKKEKKFKLCSQTIILCAQWTLKQMWMVAS